MSNASKTQQKAILIVRVGDFKRLHENKSIRNVHLICVGKKWYIACKYKRSTLGIGSNLRGLRSFASLDAAMRAFEEAGVNSFKVDTRFAEQKPDDVRYGTVAYENWVHQSVWEVLPDPNHKAVEFDPTPLIDFSKQIKNKAFQAQPSL